MNKQKKYAHAYIVEGIDTLQRKNFLKDFISDILCENLDKNGKSCKKCASCHRVERETHEDVVRMKHSGKELYTVKDTLDFIEQLSMRAYGTYKVGIIENAEQMSETVQNKLLKTLEEPYPQTVIILTTSNRESLLQTVRSRCVLLRINENVFNRKEKNKEMDLVQLFKKKSFFFKVRECIDKTIENREVAIEFLDQLEMECSFSFRKKDCLSKNIEKQLQIIDCIEQARKDIERGMNFKLAIKRLYLEIN